MLVLVRHAYAVVRKETPSELWHLSPEGRAAAETLATGSQFAPLARVYSSTEPKALGTAQRICAQNALPLSVEPALHEVDRPWSDADYRALAMDYIRGEAVPGWEPRDRAAARMHEAVTRIAATHGEADVGIVSHGLVLSLLIGGIVGLDGPATAELWSGIALPDWAVLDVASRRLSRPFSGGAG